MPEAEVRKLNRSNLTFYILIIVIIFLSVYLLWFTRTESYKCMTSPLVYGAARISTDDNPVSCSCVMHGNSEQVLSFNRDNMTLINTLGYLP